MHEVLNNRRAVNGENHGQHEQMVVSATTLAQLPGRGSIREMALPTFFLSSFLSFYLSFFHSSLFSFFFCSSLSLSHSLSLWILLSSVNPSLSLFLFLSLIRSPSPSSLFIFYIHASIFLPDYLSFIICLSLCLSPMCPLSHHLSL